ncbi:neuropeptide FF receptor 2-like [Stylophora pistillata]|uniref:neuropeptide FF receptor 2-like n=1 Tax=Stylophora pistillata TaxID=50429 RepID=UPI000C04F7D3|nr:neuropeptide FF receptor 2-like [Stylophora pistillata]
MANVSVQNFSQSLQGDCGSATCVFSRGVLTFIVVSMFSVAAISLLGNIPILVAILCSTKRRNKSNLSTLSLAVSDLLITIFCIPFVTFDLFILDHWIFGRVMCRVVTLVQNTAMTASVLNLLTITCEKFLAVRFPFNVRLRKKLVCFLLPMGWIVALTGAACYARFKELYKFDDNTYICGEDWSNVIALRNTNIVILTLFFGPLFLITLFHSITIYTLVKGKRDLQFQLNRSERDSLRKVLVKHKRQRKAVKIILLTLVSIIICWGPMYSFLLCKMIVTLSNTRAIIIGYTVCICLLFSHCSIFPLIYFFLTHKGKETIAICTLCLKNCTLRGTSSRMGSMLLDSSNYHGGSTKIVGSLRNSSWRRSSTPAFTPGAETRL